MLMNPASCLYVVGAGGHFSAVREVAWDQGWKVCQVFEIFDNSLTPIPSADVTACSNIGETHAWVVAIGDNKARLSAAHYVQKNFPRAIFPALVHRSAQVAKSAQIGQGAAIMPFAHIGPEAKIGDFSIVNTNGNVEHHATLGEAAHLAPGAVLLGGATSGASSIVGAGAIVAPGVVLPSNSTLAALSFFSGGERQGLYAGTPADLKKSFL